MKTIDTIEELGLNEETIVQAYDNVKLSKEVEEQVTQSGYDVIYFVNNEATATTAKWEDDDEEDWNRLSDLGTDLDKNREKARFLARENAFIKRALRLYKMYVFGSDFDITLKPFYDDDDPSESQHKKDKKIIKRANRAWNRFLHHNNKWWTPDEFGTRTWRDGEQFSVIKQDQWPCELRFIDPEEISDPKNQPEGTPQFLGIVTDPDDVCTIKEYMRIEVQNNREVPRGVLKERVDPDRMFHSKIDVDSTEKRGRSRFYPVISWIRKLEGLVSNEVTHRSLQSSIVLVRKVAGGSTAAQGILNNAKTGTTTYPEQTLNREKIRPGSIVTIGNGSELDFASPNGQFSDASPLVKVLIVFLSAATGWSYSMLTTDASDGSFASSLTNESPVLQMVMDERKYFRDELIPIFKWVIESAIAAGEIDDVSLEDVWERFDPEFHYGDIVSRDPLKDAQAANIGVMAGALSKREAARRMKADPDKMIREIEDETEKSMDNMLGITNPMNPTLQDKQSSSQSNLQDGQGTNQGDNEPIQHKDKVS